MGVYAIDRAWSDRWLPILRTLIGPYLLGPATFEQDIHEASDLVVLHGRDIRVACRIRRYGFADLYPRQFTLRSRRDNGTQTELAKVINGWGDWLFYGHATQDETAIRPWWLIDLRSVRAHLIRRNSSPIRTGQIENPGDGTWFRWFEIDSFIGDPPLLIAESDPPVPVLELDDEIDAASGEDGRLF